MPTADIVIVGGGFAGCAAALRLLELGIRPILIEYKFFLGGRTTSYVVKEWPEPLDNGQHVLLGCCSESRRFLEAVGAPDAVEWHKLIPMADGNASIRTIKPWPIFAPLHLIPFLASFPGLGTADRFRIAWGMYKMATSPADSPDELWTEAARKFGQTEEIRKRFWDPFLVSALNANPDRISSRSVRQIVTEAFLGSRNGIDVGIPSLPLSKIFNDRIRPALEKRGAILKMGKRVLRFSRISRSAAPSAGVSDAGLNDTGGGFVVHLHDQSALKAKKIILATSPSAAKMILEETTGVEESAKLINPVLGGSPIISIHLLYDRILTHLPFCQVFGKMIQWIFNKGVYNGQQHLQAVISAADLETEQSRTELAISVDAEIRAALGVDACVIRSTAFIEKNATFTPKPNIARPKVDSCNHRDLFLAGDYVDTGWPATIESAVRSGYAAAERAAGVERRMASTVRS